MVEVTPGEAREGAAEAEVLAEDVGKDAGALARGAGRGNLGRDLWRGVQKNKIYNFIADLITPRAQKAIIKMAKGLPPAMREKLDLTTEASFREFARRGVQLQKQGLTEAGVKALNERDASAYEFAKGQAAKDAKAGAAASAARFTGPVDRVELARAEKAFDETWKKNNLTFFGLGRPGGLFRPGPPKGVDPVKWYDDATAAILKKRHTLHEEKQWWQFWRREPQVGPKTLARREAVLEKEELAKVNERIAAWEKAHNGEHYDPQKRSELEKAAKGSAKEKAAKEYPQNRGLPKETPANGEKKSGGLWSGVGKFVKGAFTTIKWTIAAAVTAVSVAVGTWVDKNVGKFLKYGNPSALHKWRKDAADAEDAKPDRDLASQIIVGPLKRGLDWATVPLDWLESIGGKPGDKKGAPQAPAAAAGAGGDQPATSDAPAQDGTSAAPVTAPIVGANDSPYDGATTAVTGINQHANYVATGPKLRGPNKDDYQDRLEFDDKGMPKLGGDALDMGQHEVGYGAHLKQNADHSVTIWNDRGETVTFKRGADGKVQTVDAPAAAPPAAQPAPPASLRNENAKGAAAQQPQAVTKTGAKPAEKTARPTQVAVPAGYF